MSVVSDVVTSLKQISNCRSVKHGSRSRSPTPPMLVRKYVDENGSGATKATKRSAGVAPEVNIRECITSLMPLPNANNSPHACFETQRRHHHKSKTVSVPTKGHMSTEN